MQAYEAGVYMLQNRGCEEITGESKTLVTHRIEKKTRDYETKAPRTRLRATPQNMDPAKDSSRHAKIRLAFMCKLC